MSTEPTNPPEGSSWGDAAPAAEPGAKKGWTGRKTAIAVGVAVLIVAGGGVAIAVGTSGNSDAAQQGPGGGPNGGFPGGGNFQGGAAGGIAALRGALHGDFVVADTTGAYVNERLQTGDVTAISATSISLTSKDGYKQTYTLDGSTQKTADPKTGESVTVIAKITGDTAAATSVTSGTAAQRPGGQGGPATGQRGNNRQGGAPGEAPAPGGN
jgi:hypothetical protein